MTCPASFSSAIEPRECGVDGQQVEAALGRLARQRPGQREDRPQAEHDRQEVADAPGHEAAERVEVDRLAEQAADRGRQRGQAGDERLAELDRRELRRDAYGAPVAIMNSAATPPTRIAARRLSRTVLP